MTGQRFLLDWPSWADVASTASALAALVLLWATIALYIETKRMRKSSDLAVAEAQRDRQLNERIHEWNVSVHEASMEPRFALYVDIDEVEKLESVIFENVTDNPAYDVSLKFTPDIVLNVYKPGGHPNPKLSKLFPRTYATIGPRQRLVRTFSILTDGSGDFDFVGHFDNIEVEVVYRVEPGGDVRTSLLPMDSHHAWKQIFKHPNTLMAFKEQMRSSLEELTTVIRDARPATQQFVENGLPPRVLKRFRRHPQLRRRRSPRLN